MRLKDKVALITGASRGLGHDMAIGMAKEGATIVVAARTEAVTDERLPGTIYETVKQIEDAGGKALAVKCNVADPAQVEAAVKQALDTLGRIDILVNNAAVQPPGRIAGIQIRHWDLEMKINVNGPFYATRAVIDAMTAQGGGNIINISSIAATSRPRSGHYGVTKIALEAMTEMFAFELKDAGIAVNALKPRGGVITPGFLFARGGVAPEGSVTSEDFTEASVIMATATAATLTGSTMFDYEVLERWGRGNTIAG
ncbi:MAG: SDR family NAD(P)-dependent oxidoreductase [Dehalococcoidia bacterium]